MMKTTALVLMIQLLALFALFFGDVGFDKAGRYGLDFTHFLVLTGLQFIGVAASVWISIAKKSWLPASLSCAIAVTAVVVFVA